MDEDNKGALAVVGVVGMVLTPIIAKIFTVVLIVFFVVSIFTTFEVEDEKDENSSVFNTGLGSLSEKYESNGDPGCIANNAGDIGGKSYGAWQLASKVGSLDGFLQWLQGKDKGMYDRLMEAYKKDGNTYGSNFDSTWKAIATENKDGFYKIQWEYIKISHYDPVVKHFADSGIIDFNKRTKTLQNVVWSTAVQHGVGGAIGIIEKQNLKVNDLKEDEGIIKGIYSERMKVDVYFKNSSDDIKKGVYNRFIKEQDDALKMLEQELNGFAWPVPSSKNITSIFGMRKNPTGEGNENHTGIDIAANYGENIIAADSGTIEVSDVVSGYGNYIKINHGNGTYTAYGHCSARLVSSGDKVNKGDVIGKIGSTGNSTGNHLHFEVIKNGVREDPLNYVNPNK
jgi:murein DD-endopeptidase MepM/ murein hydrolase activator NlpD